MSVSHVKQLSEELNLGSLPPLDEQKFQHLRIGSFNIAIKELEPGYYLCSEIGPLPKNKEEEFLMLAMKANFLGQGTGGSTIGLKENESSLTLSLHLPEEMPYRGFKDYLEEFINYLDYWTKTIKELT